MTVVNINDLKEQRAVRMQQKMAEVLEDCADIDQDAYRYAAVQASYIESAILASDAPSIKIQIESDWYELPIIHMDVLNEVCIMLDRLQKLGKEEDTPESESNMLEDWFVMNRDELVKINGYKDVRENEYIDNIFELARTKGLYDADTPYVLSRLLLARDNLADDNIDCFTFIDLLIVSISYIMAQLFDK